MTSQRGSGGGSTPPSIPGGATEACAEVAQFQALFDFMPQLGWYAAPDGAIQFYNRGWYDYTGTTFEQMQGWGWTQVHDPSVLPEVLRRWKESLATGQPFEMEFPLRRHDGVFRWFLTRVAPIRDHQNTIIRWVGINTDVHERRQASVQNAEAFRLLVQSVVDYAIFTITLDGRIATWNRGAELIKGYTEEEILGRDFSILFPPEEVAAGTPRKNLETALRLGRFEAEGWRMRKDGTRFFASVTLTPLKDEAGVVSGFAKVTRDITTRRMLQEVSRERQQMEEDRDTLFKIASDLIAIGGLETGRLHTLSPSWTKTLGWSEEELTAKPWLSFVHPDDVEKTIAAGNTLAQGASVVDFENRYRCKDGSFRTLQWRCVPLLERKLTYAIARDITELLARRAAQEQMQQQLLIADRMVSMGTLAAGMAHEINNPLSYVMSNLSTLAEELEAKPGSTPDPGALPELAAMVKDALEGTERVRKIVRSLKTFSRADQDDRQRQEITGALEMAIEMSFNQIRHRARLVKSYGRTPLVFVDEARLGQVFINLLVNAAQAMPVGKAEANEIRVSTSTDADGWLVVEIADTGSGIPPEVIGRIFDPFFTTKPVGEGTGLGLSICHHIVTSMGGTISVSSVVGKGTTFRVALPPAADDARPASRSGAVRVPAHERARVLVVDDEELVRAGIQRVLGQHEVTSVGSAQQALDLLASGKRFDIIFSDLMMPQVSGMELYDRLRARAPEDAERMVFVTGGAFTPAAAAFIQSVTNDVVEKPFDSSLLRRLVHKALQRRPAGVV